MARPDVLHAQCSVGFGGHGRAVVRRVSLSGSEEGQSERGVVLHRTSRTNLTFKPLACPCRTLLSSVCRADPSAKPRADVWQNAAGRAGKVRAEV